MNHRKSPPFVLAALALITLLFISCVELETIVNGFISTPTPTHTATPTSTPTPTPTSTPTITPTALPDLSQVTLTLDDFPLGFEVVSQKDCGILEEAPGMDSNISRKTQDMDSFETESFCFLESEHFEAIFGFTISLPTRLMQADFDARLRQPETRETIFEGMGDDVEIFEQGDLPIPQDIGDTSAGFTLLIDDRGVPTRIDTIVFRRGEVGACIWIVYINRDVPVMTVDEIARKLDARIIQVFPVQ